MSTSDILESLIEKDNGYLITSKAIESGVSKPSVSKHVREHDMEKVDVYKRQIRRIAGRSSCFQNGNNCGRRQAVQYKLLQSGCYYCCRIPC